MQHTCTLDKFRAQDTDSLVRLLTDPAVRAFLGGPVEASVAMRRVQAQLQNNGDMPAWAIRPLGADPDQLLGSVSLDPHHDGADIEVSYALLPEHQGLGYAAGALQLALHHAFQTMSLPRVVAETQAANARSVLLLERAGMSLLRTVTRFGALQSIYVMHSGLPHGPRPNHSFEPTPFGEAQFKR